MNGELHPLVWKPLQTFVQFGAVCDDTRSVQNAVAKAFQNALTLFEKQAVVIRMELRRHKPMIPLLLNLRT